MAEGTADRNGSEGSGAKAARTRSRVLDAAAKVLSRKGFAGARLSDIAKEARLQAPAIYYHYSSRDELIENVMYVGASGLRAHLERTLAELPPTATPSDRVAAAVEAHLRHSLEISDYTTAIIRNAGQVPEAVAQRANNEVAVYYQFWRELIAQLAAAGELRADVDPAIARMIVLGALNWAAEWWNPERGPLDEVIRTAQSMVLHALRP